MEAVLLSLLSNDNHARRAAERAFSEQKAAAPREVLLGLWQAATAGSVAATAFDGLSATISSAKAQPLEVRALSCVLLRGIAVRETALWSSLTPHEFNLFRTGLLGALLAEPMEYLQKKIADIICPLAKLNDWPELLQLMVELSSHTDQPRHIHLALYLLDKLCEYIGATLVSNTPLVLEIVAYHIGSVDVHTQALAVLAFGSFLFEIPELTEPIGQMLTRIHPVLVHLIVNAQAFDPALEILSSLSRLAQEKAELFAMSWGPMLECALSICRLPDPDLFVEGIKIQALELASALLTQKKSRFASSPATRSAFLELVLSLVVSGHHHQAEESGDDDCTGHGHLDANNMSVELREFLATKTSDHEDDEIANDLLSHAIMTLEIFSRSFRVKEVLVPAVELTTRLLASPRWVDRKAALVILRTITEGTASGLHVHLPTLVPALLGLISDPHPRVQFEALQCLSVIILEFDGEIRSRKSADADESSAADSHQGKRGGAGEGQSDAKGSRGEEEAAEGDGDGEDDDEDEAAARLKSVQKLFPSLLPQGLCAFLQSERSRPPLLLATTLGSLRAFFNPDRCKPKLCKPFAANLIDFCLSLLTSPQYPTFVKCEAVSLLANVAVLSPLSIVRPRYANLSARLKGLLATASPTTQTAASAASAEAMGEHQELNLLKGKCLECFALVGRAIGKEAFFRDAVDLLATLSGMLEQGLDYSDSLSSYIVQTCARIAGVIGDDFQPFVPRILPPLLRNIAEPLAFDIHDEASQTLAGAAGGSDASSSAGGANGAAGSNSYSVYKRGLGQIKVNYNSHQIIEREMALRVLYQYCLDIPDLVWTFTPDIIASVAHNLDCPAANDDIYMIACAILSDSLKLFTKNCDLMSHRQERAPIEAGALQETLTLIDQMVSAAISAVLSGIERHQTAESHRYTPSPTVYVMIDGLRDLLKVLFDAKASYEPALHAGRGFPIVLSSQASDSILHAVQDEIAIWIQRKYIDRVEFEREEDRQTEEDIWNCLIDVIGWLVKFKGNSIASDFFVNDFLPFSQGILGNGNETQEMKLFPLCIFLDLVEHAPALAAPCADAVRPVLFQTLLGSDALEIVVRASSLSTCRRQLPVLPVLMLPSIFGLGVLAQHAGGAIEAALQAGGLDANQLIERLARMASIDAPGNLLGPAPQAAGKRGKSAAAAASAAAEDEEEEDDEEEAEAYRSQLLLFKDNAISSLLKLAVFQGQYFGGLLESVLANHLPLSHDLNEAKEVHKLLVQLFATLDPRLLGPEVHFLGHLTRILAQLVMSVQSEQELSAEMLEDEDFWLEQPITSATLLQTIELLKRLVAGQVDLPRAVLAATWQGLPAELRQFLSYIAASSP